HCWRRETGHRLADVSTTSGTEYPLSPRYHQKYRFPSEPMLAMFSVPSFTVTAGLPGPVKGDGCVKLGGTRTVCCQVPVPLVVAKSASAPNHPLLTTCTTPASVVTAGVSEIRPARGCGCHVAVPLTAQ